MHDGTATILVVEDAPEEILILETLLADQYAVQTASDGRGALAYLDTGGIADLIVTDLLMPEMDGFELCRRLKEIPRLGDAPVIVLTARDSPGDEERALSLGAADFIHKPISPPILMARVRHHLELRRMERPAARGEPRPAAQAQEGRGAFAARGGGAAGDGERGGYYRPRWPHRLDQSCVHGRERLRGRGGPRPRPRHLEVGKAQPSLLPGPVADHHPRARMAWRAHQSAPRTGRP
jgi:CheY-like chemotaxis protein